MHNVNYALVIHQASCHYPRMSVDANAKKSCYDFR